MKLNKFAYLYSKPLGNHTLKIMKNILGNLLKNLEISWNFVSLKKWEPWPDDLFTLTDADSDSNPVPVLGS